MFALLIFSLFCLSYAIITLAIMKCEFNDSQGDIKRTVRCFSLHVTLFEKLPLPGPWLSD